ncbi:hypothetical protein [Actimicrobium sp. GrIS 1.19]|uniref:hypothetical protein n=1 Tax=Actimicrobium sp. GrIS 1.19 TaxID=3071708 RepID=UPI002E168678
MYSIPARAEEGDASALQEPNDVANDALAPIALEAGDEALPVAGEPVEPVRADSIMAVEAEPADAFWPGDPVTENSATAVVEEIIGKEEPVAVALEPGNQESVAVAPEPADDEPVAVGLEPADPDTVLTPAASAPDAMDEAVTPPAAAAEEAVRPAPPVVMAPPVAEPLDPQQQEANRIVEQLAAEQRNADIAIEQLGAATQEVPLVVEELAVRHPEIASSAAPVAPAETPVVTAQAAAASSGDEWLTLNNRALDAIRGGFDVGNGLIVTFGIARAVYINGNLVTTTALNIGDLSKVTPEQAMAFNRQATALNLVQNGPGNTFQPGAGSVNSPTTVIQNTLSNQNIRSQTIINATSNALGMVKGLNTMSTLRDALSNSVGAK